MSHEYYIIQNKGHQGPYDMVALVIKIRNGSLKPDMQVQRSDSEEHKAAAGWEELAQFFVDAAQADADNAASKNEPAKQQYIRKLYLLDSLKSGLNFLQHNQISTLFSGLFILLMLLGAVTVNFLIPPEWHALCCIIGFILLHFLLSSYLLLVLRMTRGQPMNLPYFIRKIGARFFKLIRASLLASFPVIAGFVLFMHFEDDLLVSIIGLLIIIIPGIYTITIYSFVPLLIVDKDYGVWEAMETSRHAIFKGGSDNFGVYFSLNSINFIAGLFMLLPMAVTLPVTMSAMTELYDELFS